MEDETARDSRRDPHSMQQAITVIVIIVLIIISPDVATAVISIGLVLAIYYGSTQARARARARAPARAAPPPREKFNLPGAMAPYAASAGRQAPPGAPGGYKGAIDVDEYDGEAAYGYRDRTEGDNEIAPEGNPYNLTRLASPEAAGPCVDDEANDDTLDGDERMNYQARSRNDPTRVDVGIMNRRKDVERYVREEVEEAEDREWWGRHEY